MKNLYLLRHGESDYSNRIDDLKRPLNNNGILGSQLIGTYLNDKNIKLDKILCSSSIRTRETLKNLNQTYNIKTNTNFIDKLYLATAGEIIKIILKQEKEENFCSVLVIAHNPGIENLARLLIKENQAKDLKQKYNIYPPCGLIHLSAKINSWQNIELDNFDLENYTCPELLTQLRAL